MPFENKLKQILQQGKVVFGVTVQISSETLVEIIGYAGFDFVFIDTEHGQIDLQSAGRLIRVADSVGMTPLVRVMKNDAAEILKALDLGAKGIIVPHISTKEDAQLAVRACKYGPGGRGSCPLVRANRYGLDDWPQYQDAANRNTMFIALIENVAAVENIDEILTVDGIDAVFIGAFDMSVDAGCKGNVQSPKIQRCIQTIIDACNKKSIPVMHTTTNGPDIKAWVDKGVRIIVQGSDSRIFGRACAEIIKSVEQFRK